jgi:hypothetical protein
MAHAHLAGLQVRLQTLAFAGDNVRHVVRFQAQQELAQTAHAARSCVLECVMCCHSGGGAQGRRLGVAAWHAHGPSSASAAVVGAITSRTTIMVGKHSQYWCCVFALKCSRFGLARSGRPKGLGAIGILSHMATAFLAPLAPLAPPAPLQHGGAPSKSGTMADHRRGRWGACTAQM